MSAQHEALERAQGHLSQAAAHTDDAARELAVVASEAMEVHVGFAWSAPGEEDIRPGPGDLRLDLMAATRYAQEAGKVADTLHRWSAGFQEALDRARGPEPKVEATK